MSNLNVQKLREWVWEWPWTFKVVLHVITVNFGTTTTTLLRLLLRLLPWLQELSKSVRTTLAQLRSGHCQLLNSYKARITAGVTDVCPDCGVAPHSIEHLFQCPACPTQPTTQDLWDDPVMVADVLKLDDNWRKEGSCGTTTTTGSRTLGFRRRPYGWLFHAIAGLLVYAIFIAKQL